MRTAALIGALLLTFVAVPGGILALHSPPSPPRINPAALGLLNRIDALDLAGVDCHAVHRRVICTTETSDDRAALAGALDGDPVAGSCETRKHRIVCIVGGDV